MRRTAMGLMGPGLMRPIFRFLHFPLGFFTLGDPWSPKIDTANGSRKRNTNCKAMRKIVVNMNVCVSPQGACQHTAVVHVVPYDDAAVCIPRYLCRLFCMNALTNFAYMQTGRTRAPGCTHGLIQNLRHQKDLQMIYRLAWLILVWSQCFGKTVRKCHGGFGPAALCSLPPSFSVPRSQPKTLALDPEISRATEPRQSQIWRFYMFDFF